MTEFAGEAGDLDRAAEKVLAAGWGLTGPVERAEVGVNKATWRAGRYWLACDYPRAAGYVSRTRVLLARLVADPRLELAVPCLVPASDGLVVHAHNRAWWLTGHVSGRQPDPRSAADTAAVAAGLARLHAFLRDIPADLAVSDDDLVSLFASGVRLAADPRLGFCPEDQRTAGRAAAVAGEHICGLQLAERQLIHGDPSHPNLRVHDGPVRLTGALDWDQARADLILADVATVAETVVFRSGTARPLGALETMLHAYMAAGGTAVTLDDAIAGLVMVKFESIAHHGARYLRGETSRATVASQLAKIRLVLELRGRR